MRKIILLILSLCTAFSACQKFDDTDIWDSINSLDKRVEALEKLCREMNTNIDALQSLVKALENQDYITNVSPINDNGKVIGYTISFAKDDPITIYHGQDGKDGQNGADGKDGADGQDGKDGQDGQTPIIGVAKDTDGIYYWTLNGQWLLDDNGQKIKAVGTDGQNGSNGQDGATGAPGQDGTPGQDGITPQLKIEDGKWFVSYDNGANWVEVGQATGDQGPQGTPGVDGDAFFQSVDTSSSDYVTFVLSNGTEIKIPTWSAFEALKQQCEQMNANIEALQVIVNALENNDYIKSITPIYDGVKEIGYIIEFTQSGKVTIYHGKDGQNGANGSNGTNGIDGHTPIIGVAKDSDGIYYWTVDGAWLIDSDGQKVKAVGTDGQNGSNGSNGQDGTPGQDGITPQLKIEDGKWFVSYDNGANWVEVGQATGDQGPQGPQGKPGVGGDSMFADFDYSSNSDYVVFVLSDGTEIKIPTWYAFEELKKAVEELNNNVDALRVIVQALENNDYVKSVTPLPDGSGYVIEFVKSGVVTIYHGKDGSDGNDGAPGSDGEGGAPGADGADGHTPVIAVAVDPDTGDWCWTIDGEWLLDGSGNKIIAVGRDGKDGQDGEDGTPGADGKDGVTPKFKIEDGYWYVSYDGGSSWELAGKATGDQGGTGATGDSMFDKIDVSDENYVIMVLTNGSTIKLPTWSAFEALKQQCEQMNVNIEALQVIVNALENNDYIKSITPIYDGVKEIGYIIEFTQSGKVTIYHGKDGQNGANGSNGANGIDGHTPIIGVAKDTDGIYYWTVDGTWLIDSDGQKVKAVGTDGQNGSNGQDGATGAPGQDGITPQLKIEDGKWFVSYDNGASWVEVGQATGDQGLQGNPGENGDAFFQSVTETNDYVLMVLANGTEIKIPKYSAVAAILTLDKVTGFTATFNGQVIRHSLDLKVTVYYSTTDNLTVYKHKGKTSVTEFNGDTFTLRLTELAANTTYYYFIEVICNGTITFSEISSFRTGAEDSYVDWGEGENVGGDI